MRWADVPKPRSARVLPVKDRSRPREGSHVSSCCVPYERCELHSCYQNVSQHTSFIAHFPCPPEVLRQALRRRDDSFTQSARTLRPTFPAPLAKSRLDQCIVLGSAACHNLMFTARRAFSCTDQAVATVECRRRPQSIRHAQLFRIFTLYFNSSAKSQFLTNHWQTI